MNARTARRAQSESCRCISMQPGIFITDRKIARDHAAFARSAFRWNAPDFVRAFALDVKLLLCAVYMETNPILVQLFARTHEAHFQGIRLWRIQSESANVLKMHYYRCSSSWLKTLNRYKRAQLQLNISSGYERLQNASTKLYSRIV